MPDIPERRKKITVREEDVPRILAWAKGFGMGEAGTVPIDANPFPDDGVERRAWDEGWAAGRRHGEFERSIPEGEEGPE